MRLLVQTLALWARDQLSRLLTSHEPYRSRRRGAGGAARGVGPEPVAVCVGSAHACVQSLTISATGPRKRCWILASVSRPPRTPAASCMDRPRPEQVGQPPPEEAPVCSKIIFAGL